VAGCVVRGLQWAAVAAVGRGLAGQDRGAEQGGAGRSRAEQGGAGRSSWELCKCRLVGRGAWLGSEFELHVQAIQHLSWVLTTGPLDARLPCPAARCMRLVARPWPWPHAWRRAVQLPHTNRRCAGVQQQRRTARHMPRSGCFERPPCDGLPALRRRAAGRRPQSGAGAAPAAAAGSCRRPARPSQQAARRRRRPRPQPKSGASGARSLLASRRRPAAGPVTPQHKKRATGMHAAGGRRRRPSLRIRAGGRLFSDCARARRAAPPQLPPQLPQLPPNTPSGDETSVAWSAARGGRGGGLAGGSPAAPAPRGAPWGAVVSPGLRSLWPRPAAPRPG
jgi:hypothetical protein